MLPFNQILEMSLLELRSAYDKGYFLVSTLYSSSHSPVVEVRFLKSAVV